MNQNQEDLHVPASPVTLDEFRVLYSKVLHRLSQHASSLKIETIKLDLDYLMRRSEIGFRLHEDKMN